MTANARDATESRPTTAVVLHGPETFESRLPAWEARFEQGAAPRSLTHHPRWLRVLRDGLQHRPYGIEAVQDDRVAGVLPLACVRSVLFGRFLVSLPYLNSGGVLSDAEDAGLAMIERAVELAGALQVRHLELRHEQEWKHPALNGCLTSKVHMRLQLPASADALWKSFDPKVRNQVRKGEKSGYTLAWGTRELLADFYDVFSRNMRDLGTPVFSRRLFAAVLREFPDAAELCVLRDASRPVAAALLCHGRGVTEVPSASSLRELGSTNANMLMYWQLLRRAIERGQQVFDFGRSSPDSGTFRFKKQWGAEPVPAIWQYHVRQGEIADMRREGGKYDKFIEVWKRLPLGLTRWLGPPIVRGIP